MNASRVVCACRFWWLVAMAGAETGRRVVIPRINVRGHEHRDILIENITGYTGDDLVALTANGVDLKAAPLVVGPKLEMDSAKERFVGHRSERANLMLKDTYRTRRIPRARRQRWPSGRRPGVCGSRWAIDGPIPRRLAETLNNAGTSMRKL